jgi:hypothetical protein
MFKLIHKYLRRLVVWVQTPSEEETEAHADYMRDLRRKRLARSIPYAFAKQCYYSHWIGLTPLEKNELITDVENYGAHNNIQSNDIAALQRLIMNNGIQAKAAA